MAQIKADEIEALSGRLSPLAKILSGRKPRVEGSLTRKGLWHK